MAGKNKSGGGAKKIGRDIAHCKRYKDRLTRFNNKLKHWLKHNIAKNSTQQQTDAKRKEFKQIQENRKKK